MTDRGILFVFSGPSGSGKGTILSNYFEKYDDQNIKYSVSATTRAPREGEVDGVNYYFISTKDFDNMIKNNELLEWTCYCDNKYGTPLKAVTKMLDNGTDMLLEIETEGAVNVKKMYPDAVSIFVLPPSVTELKHRLTGRATEEKDVINKRIQTAIKEIGMADQYDYVLLNDSLDSAVEGFRAIVMAERFKTNNNKNTISEVLKK